MLQETLAGRLGAFVAGFSLDQVPERVRERAKLSVLDMLGVMLAAWEEPSTGPVYQLVLEGGGRPQSTVLGGWQKVSALDAALVNGVLSHSIELDDHTSHRRSLNHPGVTAIPPALALAEAAGLSGRRFLESVILGYEISGRLSLACEPGWLNYEKGFHETPLCGVFGAAAAAGKALGLSAPAMANAFGIAGSMAAGSYEFKASGAWTKRLHAGHASRDGVMAAMLAAKGFTGPPTVFEGKSGFFRSYAGEGHYDLAAVERNLGEEWELDYIQCKPFACAGVLHAPLTAAQAVLQKRRFQRGEIARVTVETARKLILEYAEPREQKVRPATTVDAQFSLPFSLAALLCHGQALVDEYSEEGIRDPEVLRVAEQVIPLVDPEIDRVWPAREPCRVTVRTVAGEEISARVEGAKGDLENPVTAAEIRDKFRALTARVLSPAAQERVVEACAALENLAGAGELVRLLQGQE